MSASAMETSNRLVRLLCLHGHDQNATIFRQKTGSLRKALKGTTEFIYVDAPHQVTSSTPALRTWWQRPSTDTQTTPVYEGWEESRNRIQESIQEHWPIDILLGFSQGAAAAAMYLAEQQHHERLSLMSVAGFIPRDTQLFSPDVAQMHLAGIPSCHIYGDTDDIITPEQSIELSRVFDPSKVVVCSHGGGHMVPTLRKGDTSSYDGDDENVRRVVVLSQKVKDFVKGSMETVCPPLV